MASQGDVSKRTRGELDECNRRLKALRIELTAAMQKSQQQSSPVPNIRSRTASGNRAPSRIAEIDNETDTTVNPNSSLLNQSHTLRHMSHQFTLTAASNSQQQSACCYHCHDLLFGNNQSVECQSCHLVCHKFCHTSISIDCRQYHALLNSRKFYLMAADESDRGRWLYLLESMASALRKSESMLLQDCLSDSNSSLS